MEENSPKNLPESRRFHALRPLLRQNFKQKQQGKPQPLLISPLKNAKTIQIKFSSLKTRGPTYKPLTVPSRIYQRSIRFSTGGT